MNSRQHSAVEVFIFSTVILLLWMAAGWNYENADYANYNIRYSSVQENGFNPLTIDFGYDFLQHIFIILNINYQGFRIAIYGLGLLAIGIFVYRWSYLPLWVLLFYVLSHFLRDSVQTRNFLGSILVLFTIECCGQHGRKHYLFLLLLLCSFSIHMTFILYFVFLFADYRKWNYWFLFGVGVLLSVFSDSIVNGFSSLLTYEGVFERTDNYLQLQNQYALPLAAMLAFGNGICINYFHKHVENSKFYSLTIRHLTIVKYSFIIYNLNALSNILVAFSAINGSFYSRLFGNILLWNIIYFTNVIYLTKRKGTLVCILTIYMIIYIFLLQIRPFSEHFDYLMQCSLLFK